MYLTYENFIFLTNKVGVITISTSEDHCDGYMKYFLRVLSERQSKVRIVGVRF